MEVVAAAAVLREEKRAVIGGLAVRERKGSAERGHDGYGSCRRVCGRKKGAEGDERGIRSSKWWESRSLKRQLDIWIELCSVKGMPLAGIY